MSAETVYLIVLLLIGLGILWNHFRPPLRIDASAIKQGTLFLNSRQQRQAVRGIDFQPGLGRVQVVGDLDTAGGITIGRGTEVVVTGSVFAKGLLCNQATIAGVEKYVLTEVGSKYGDLVASQLHLDD